MIMIVIITVQYLICVCVCSERRYRHTASKQKNCCFEPFWTSEVTARLRVGRQKCYGSDFFNRALGVSLTTCRYPWFELFMIKDC